ncbi:MAG: Photosystem I P700 chlorophyll a apoprotein A2 [Elusimicrobia bacterium ADurb.Bin231]|nr:MAG: Photosystem I P700 chlorophyll a apoprotein A2 [Elusimicrobia bacterium ADurb.Bin231]
MAISFRNRHRQPEDSTDKWLQSYGDMVTLLFSFFVVLVSMSKLDVIKIERMTKYFAEPKKITFSDLTKKIQEYIVSEKMEEQIDVRLTSKGVEISFKDKLMFDLGKADLKEEAVPILSKISNLLNYKEISERKVLVEGHTDSLPMRSKAYPTNWELSSARAGIVVRYFLSQGLDSKRFESSGYADTRPRKLDVDPTHGQPENRRVVVVISPESYISELELWRQEIAVDTSTDTLTKTFEPGPSRPAPPVPIVKTSASRQTSQVKEDKNNSKGQLPVKSSLPKDVKAAETKSLPVPKFSSSGEVKTKVKDEQKSTSSALVKSPAKTTKISPQPVDETPTPVNVKTVNKDIDKHYSAAIKYLNSNNPKAAKQELEKVLLINPKHPMALLKLKKINRDLGIKD